LLDIFHQRETIGLSPRKRQLRKTRPLHSRAVIVGASYFIVISPASVGHLFLTSNFMAELQTSGFGLSAQRARRLIDQASVALVYLGIVATFAAVSLIGCVIWLLIW
jgi:hypothetical protein